MNGRNVAGRNVAGLICLVVLAGCTSNPPSTSPTASSTPTNTPSATVATPTPAPTPDPTLSPTSAAISHGPARNVAYETGTQVVVPGVPGLEPGLLDAYAPAESGPWPVVVMFHGGPPLDKQALSEHARRVAELGFVVFNATWGAGPPIPETYEQTLPLTSQAACAVAFAQAHAVEYGGDPATIVVFGHSFGANMAAMVAFARPEPSVGCLGSPTLGAIDALVTWEGDWLLQPTNIDWDGRLAADPNYLDGFSPLKHLAEHTDLRVAMLVSAHPYSDVNPDRPLPNSQAADAFFAPRDPSGDLRRQLEANGALSDGNLDLGETQELLFSVLEAQGNPVSLDVMPGSTHITLSDAGWDVFLAAFEKAAAND